jgi:hypothetical protein
MSAGVCAHCGAPIPPAEIDPKVTEILEVIREIKTEPAKRRPPRLHFRLIADGYREVYYLYCPDPMYSSGQFTWQIILPRGANPLNSEHEWQIFVEECE